MHQHFLSYKAVKLINPSSTRAPLFNAPALGLVSSTQLSPSCFCNDTLCVNEQLADTPVSSTCQNLHRTLLSGLCKECLISVCIFDTCLYTFIHANIYYLIVKIGGSVEVSGVSLYQPQFLAWFWQYSVLWWLRFAPSKHILGCQWGSLSVSDTLELGVCTSQWLLCRH